ncbi:helix-turn-helix domain-containing protein [Devosia sp. Naph2]|uniref:helix-turn-helix domain-containing protein n=1 Tax=Devosia polycyclovorans TaxID=3345148 RepID=UPI0035D02565
MALPHPKDEPLAYSIEQAAIVMGISKSSIYTLIDEGKLVARKFGRRTVITRFDAEVFLQSLPTVSASGAPAQSDTAAAKLSPLDQMIADQVEADRAAIYGGKLQSPLAEVEALSMTSRHRPANSNASDAGADQ